MKMFRIEVLILFVFFGLLASCADKAYDPSHDELFLGLSFGMERKAFFDTCWQNNQNGLTKHGTRDNAVLLVDSTRFDDIIDINFYPNFNDNRISEMPMTYNYQTWAPWLKDRFASKLIIDVKDAVEQQFAIKLTDKEPVNGRKLYSSTNGPLEYRLAEMDDRLVKLTITNHHYYYEE